VRRHGFEVVGWHSVGKRSSARTLLADVSPIEPRLGRLAQRIVDRVGLGHRSFDLDPRTKFVLYARKTSVSVKAPPHREPRLSKLSRARVSAPSVEEAVLEDLNLLAGARHLCDWMFDQFEPPKGGRVVEVGAGVGTFSERLLEAGAADLLLVEPEPASAGELERRFADDDRVRVVRELLPDAPTLREEAATYDLVLCQNVLEHVEDDGEAVAVMAGALRPGGCLSLLVPAHPRLYGRLDVEYGHFRRYTPERLRLLTGQAGLELERLYAFNLLGVPGWWMSNRRSRGRIGSGALRLFDLVVPAWRRLEAALQPHVGLSIVAHARKPS
jgi:SAM-dependent methyltransferase